MDGFVHLHVHTQFSILDGASNIQGLINKIKENGMNAIAITDHGNMYGVKRFHDIAIKEGIKPIIGCEIYVASKSRFDKKEKEDRSGNHLIVLAKNKTGYKNLVKLVSYAWTEGHYYKPRVDKELLQKYHEGLIVSSACLAGAIPRAIINNNIEKAEEIILEFKNLFGDDFYLELMNHGIEEQTIVNKALIELSKKLEVKLIATNDVHFVNFEDADAHDILICLNTGKDIDDPNRLRYTQNEFLRTKEEMYELFSNIPEALSNTVELAEKIEVYELNHAPIMPDFPLPDGFENEDDYLKYITYKGAEKRYSEITQEIKDRIDFELSVVKKMGFPGYFLIVQDFLNAAREMNVSVGPGRGSAAGSVVAYCIKITDIDPLKYNLLFERFLNPDRISMPDIDIDFDEDGREDVLKWVVDKYGKNRVAQVITFGTMAAKMAIRDVARVQKLPLPDADKLAKLVPERPGITLSKAYKEVKELKDAKSSDNELIVKTLKFAETLEGSVRHTGLHACGVIICKDDLIEHIPLCIKEKETNLLVTQFDGKYIEDVGMLKMDFLGLKTLSIIKDAVENVKMSKGVDIDINNLSLEDEKTYQLYSNGETTGLFQFESPGMKKFLRELKPNKFDDLVAMNALYRPGPMEYIPSYIKRKNGKEKINYDIPEMEEYLKETYGITVYQEQVMLLAQKLAGFTRGEADSLRKAMGKKKKDMMDKLKEKFLEGCQKNNYNNKIVENIWRDWEAFAEYAFNKSHSTCYAYISYQTAYLKANFPAEYMAAVLSRNVRDIKKITIFMDECKRMGLAVLGPDVNESYLKFTVNDKGQIRFGLAAIKGVGEAPGEKIIKERTNKSQYKDIFDFISRVNLQSVNKRNLEALVKSGAFDSFNKLKRHQYFCTDKKNESFIETLIKFGNNIQKEKDTAQISLFGDSGNIEIKKPEIPICQEWSNIYRLNQEKELIGIYLSAHPLDDYKYIINDLCNSTLSEFTDFKKLNGKEITVAGIITLVKHATTKNGNPYGSITIEDYTDSYKLMIFGKDYLSFKNFFTVGYSILIKGKVRKRNYGEDELEFKINTINMLADARENLVKHILIKLPLSYLSEDKIDEIFKEIEKNKGKSELNFLIYDNIGKIWIQMFSRTHRVGVSNEFIDYLKKYSEIEFKLSE
ncbi:MAG: DNA polymerase III subunit alpha [Bacteroidales bacterium]|nr:DNA polymerase III subunit alpha [Bacteroidales bacterium]